MPKAVKIVGQCPKCGAPIWANCEFDLVLNTYFYKKIPETIYGCDCKKKERELIENSMSCLGLEELF